MMHALVHIGSPKAGSTSIQRALQMNAAALEGAGVFAWLPDPSRGNFARALANRFRGDDFRLLPIERWNFASPQEAVQWSHDNWADLAAGVRARRPALTVLSSEQLFGVAPVERVLEALAEIFDRVTIMAYLRDPADHYKSALDQFIRGGMRLRDLPLPTRFKPPSARTIRGYLKALGPGQVIVRNFDRSNLVGGDVVRDFFAQIAQVHGRPVPDPVLPPRMNESLAAAATVWLLGVNETFQRFAEGDDRAALKARRVLLNRLRTAPELAALPKLALDHPLLVDLARANARETITLFNTRFSGDQHPMPEAPEIGAPPPEAEQRAHLRDWLLGQAPGAALANVLRAAMPLSAGGEGGAVADDPQPNDAMPARSAGVRP